MRTNPYEFRMDGRSTDQAREAVGDIRVAEIQAGPTLNGTVIDKAPGLNPALPRRASPTSPHAMADGWTPAHSEAARFLGECFAVGAVLGLVTEMARPMRGKRHG
jgi:hypothetical protein